MALQQLLAGALPLRCLNLSFGISCTRASHLPALDMRSLTQLQELAMLELPEGCMLPTQLRCLRVTAVQHPSSLLAVMALQRLQQLSLGPVFQEPGPCCAWLGCLS
ncbi:hypothetical protein COO60DRAFT_1164727 [Scenedesmus sp. NREL 46B-D3]|nr:hypothetical protein COO60DRAFT_1164727 [Scenedesmus sp. NREL 46B-D3]